MNQAIAATGIVVERSNTFRLDIPTLVLPAGTILCVAGPNGSGKTTLIECLAGLLTPDLGTITIAGQQLAKNIRHIKARIGFVPDDEAWFIHGLCAREYFALLAATYTKAGIQTNMQRRIDELATLLYFTAFTLPMEQLSHGNKKKVQIIAGLMHEPPVLIVDELRNGLDPLAVIAAEQLIRDEATRGACIVAATHDLWWAQRIASHILLLVDGAVQLYATTSSITRQHGSVERAFMQTVNQLRTIHAT